MPRAARRRRLKRDAAARRWLKEVGEKFRTSGIPAAWVMRLAPPAVTTHEKE
jgi:hypothetical protein